MEVFEAVRTVLAVGEFQDTPVPPHAARRIVEATQQLARSCDTLPPHTAGPSICTAMKGDAK
jgi:hypothetical protein